MWQARQKESQILPPLLWAKENKNSKEYSSMCNLQN
jgi:hypothetical protein